jgi:hypothetical protein
MRLLTACSSCLPGGFLRRAGGTTLRGALLPLAWLALLAAMPVAQAATPERMRLENVRLDALAQDTQAVPDGAPQSHMALTWWVPYEYWSVAFLADKSLQPDAKAQVLGMLKGFSLIAVVQADINELGMFTFYDQAEVASAMKVTLGGGTAARELRPKGDVGPELTQLLGFLKPVLTAAIGNMGANMHFFVFDDVAAGGEGRVLDPYVASTLNVALRTKAGADLLGTIETPLDALFVPRLCANGKPAHVSWSYCPWDGKPL